MFPIACLACAFGAFALADALFLPPARGTISQEERGRFDAEEAALNVSVDMSTYALGFENTPASDLTYAEANFLWENTKAPAGNRVIHWDWSYPAGLDDRLYSLYHLLAIARAAEAELVVHPPTEILGNHTGDPADWWDAYITTAPPLRRYTQGEEQCHDLAPKYVANQNVHLLDAIGKPGMDALYNKSDYLCIIIRGDYWHIVEERASYGVKGKGPALADMVEKGSSLISFRTSAQVKDLRDRISATLGKSTGHYNAVHSRQGDMGFNECQSPVSVVSQMKSFASWSSEELFDEAVNKSVWYVMSDGEPWWFNELGTAAAAAGVELAMETQMSLLDTVEDNMLKYLVGQCVFSGAQSALWSYKVIGNAIFCNVGQKQQCLKQLCDDNKKWCT